MGRPAPRVLLVLGCVLLGGCLIPPPAPVPVAPCAAPAPVDTSRWVRVGGNPSFLLPASFVREERNRFIHGGTSWRSGGRRIDFVTGVWDESSFQGSRALGQFHRECQVVVDGRRVHLVTSYQSGRYSVTAWPIPDPAEVNVFGYSQILRGSSPRRGDQELFLAIAHTLRFR